MTKGTADVLWVPDSWLQRQRAATVTVEKADLTSPSERSGPRARPMYRSDVRSQVLSGSPLAASSLFEGSPRISHYELIELWRTLPWVRSAIRRIAMICISEPLQIVEARDELEEGEEPDPDAGRYLREFFGPDLMTELVNIRQLQQTVHKLYVTFVRLKLLGQCWWEIVRNGFGDEIDFTVIPGRVVANVDQHGYFTDRNRAFTQYFEGRTQDFAVDDVLAFWVPDIEGRQAASDLEALRIAAATDLYAQAWNRNSFRNQRMVPGAWIAPEDIDDAEFRRLEAEIDAFYGGVENANRSGVLVRGGVDYKSFLPQGFGRDQEYLKGRHFNRDEMFSVLGASAGILGMIEDVNRSNLEGLIKIVYDMEAKPLIEIVESTLNLWRRWKKGIAGWRIEFRRPDFAQERDEVEVASRAIGSGIKTPNQWLVEHGGEPYEGGDQFFMAANYVPVGVAATPLYQGAPEAKRAVAGAEYQPVMDELRRWKRVALKDVERGKVRKFTSTILPENLREAIEKALPELDTATEVKLYFDSVIDDLKRAGVDAAVRTAAERQIDELFDLAG